MQSWNSTTGPPVLATYKRCQINPSWLLHSLLTICVLLAPRYVCPQEDTVTSGATTSQIGGGDHGIHCWWDQIRSKQPYRVPYVPCECLPNFLVMVITLSYILNSSTWYIYYPVSWGCRIHWLHLCSGVRPP